MKGTIEVIPVESQHAPVVTSQLTTQGRSHVLVRYRTGSLCFEGEASPLPGFGNDPLRVSRASLEALQPDQVRSGAAILLAALDREGHCGNAASWEPLTQLFPTTSPSARFCFEMLCARVAAQSRAISVFQLFPARGGRTELATSFVLDPLAPSIEQQVESMLGQGVTTLKFKCGRSLVQESASILRVTQQLKSEHRLRLDFNRAASLDEVSKMMIRLRDCPIEWIEDPTHFPTGWAELRSMGMSLAIDEPLVGADLNLAEHADVLILKPMALGGFGVCLRIAEWASDNNKLVCVSHLFDGELSFEVTAALAFCIQSSPGAVGLSAHLGLAADAVRRFPWLLPDRLVVPAPP